MKRPLPSVGKLNKATTIIALAAIVGMVATFAPDGNAHAAVSDWEKGVDMLSTSPTDFGSASFDQSVKNAVAIGVNYITLNIPFYQTNWNTTDVQTGSATPTDQSLETAVAFIHSQGLHVMFKLDVYPYDQSWSGNINPADRTTWFANYASLLNHYAAVAQTAGAEQLCIGTELVDMTSADVDPANTQQWENMIAGVRKIYSGKLTYDANWGNGPAEETSKVQFWSALDYISISAYYNLDGDGSVSSLMQAWNNWNQSNIAPLESQWNKPIIFGEVGYMSIAGSYEDPWFWPATGSVDDAQQANDYQALFQYWNNYPWFAGVDLWNWSTDPNAGGPNDPNYTPQNKTAQGVMQQWFAGGSSGGGTSVAPVLSATASVTPSAPVPGQSASFAVTVNDAKAAVSNAIVDEEIYNSAGQQIFQKYVSGQNIAAGASATYDFSWTPPAAGTYALRTGVFNSNWQTLYYWNNGTLQFGASAMSPATGGTIDVWWPTNGSAISGVQPFQAILENQPVDAYNMYWQVDGGQLNAMATNNTNYPHKQADVDTGPWTWQSSGNYKVTFVSQNLSGQTIAQDSIVIHVTH